MRSLFVKSLKYITIILIISLLSQHFFTKVSENAIIEAEKKLLESGTTVLKASIGEHTKKLAVTVKDWATWDDSYEFVNNLNSDYIKSNLSDETLYNAGINMMVFFDKNGNVVYKETASLQRNQVDVTIPAELYKTNKINPVYKEIEKVINTKNRISSTIKVDQGLLIYSVAPILPSNEEGETRGALFMGRYFSSTDEEEIKSTNQLNFSTKPYIKANPEEKKLMEREEYLDEFEKTTMTRHFIINDSFNNPALFVTFNYPRVVNSSYEYMINIFAIVSGIIGTAVCIVSSNYIRILKKIISYTHK